MFSDQQAVTGIALLASGFAQLNNGIESYHWQVVVYLAWFSSLTHLTTLTILRQYFRVYHVARGWRCVLMLITALMLAVAVLPTGDGLWFTSDDYDASSPAIPALCLFPLLVSSNPQRRFSSKSLSTDSMIISIFVLFSGYIIRIIKFSEQATAFSRRWTREKPSGVLKSIREFAEQRLGGLGFVPVEVMRVLLHALSEIFASMLWEVRIIHFC